MSLRCCKQSNSRPGPSTPSASHGLTGSAIRRYRRDPGPRGLVARRRRFTSPPPLAVACRARRRKIKANQNITQRKPTRFPDRAVSRICAPFHVPRTFRGLPRLYFERARAENLFTIDFKPGWPLPPWQSAASARGGADGGLNCSRAQRLLTTPPARHDYISGPTRFSGWLLTHYLTSTQATGHLGNYLKLLTGGPGPTVAERGRASFLRSRQAQPDTKGTEQQRLALVRQVTALRPPSGNRGR